MFPLSAYESFYDDVSAYTIHNVYIHAKITEEWTLQCSIVLRKSSVNKNTKCFQKPPKASHCGSPRIFYGSRFQAAQPACENAPSRTAHCSLRVT